MVKKLTVVILALSIAWNQLPSFKDKASEQGLNFIHDHGGSGEKYYVETMGSGVCLLDYDTDCDLDIYFLQGAPLPGWNKNIVLENKLFRNDGGEWFDVTAEAGIGDRSYGIGCACADYDNDGDTDLYVTNYGPDILYRNNGDNTFTDVTQKAGIDNPEWGSSAAFIDADNNGWLDLYVVNYVEFSLDKNPWCGEKRAGRRAYCDPDVFTGIADVFYYNNGNGTFTDMSKEVGIDMDRGKGLGVVPGDFDNDGDMDIYVANDKVMNLFYINDGSGNFTEDALFIGVGFNENGRAEAGMGVDFGDVNQDGWLDLFVTNFSGESNTLYLNEQNGFFSDVTFQSGLGEPSISPLGFGTKLLDLNMDGWLDIFVVNGHVIDNISLFNHDYTHAQKKQVFLNQGNGLYVEKTEEIGGDLLEPTVGRGAAFGDLDNDGDLDVVISNNNGAANLLINENKAKGHWVTFELEGTTANRDAIGTKLTIETKSGSWVSWVNPASSYLASNDSRVQFGLGEDNVLESVKIEWPGGESVVFNNVFVDQFYHILEGGKFSTVKY